MTARQLVDMPAVRIAVYALCLGIAWAELKASVAQKADKAEVQAIATELHDIRIEIKDVKSILCQGSTDSFCRQR